MKDLINKALIDRVISEMTEDEIKKVYEVVVKDYLKSEAFRDCVHDVFNDEGIGWGIAEAMSKKLKQTMAKAKIEISF